LTLFRVQEKPVELFLDGVLHRRIDSLDELTATINFLKTDFLPSAPDIKLIVVDRLAPRHRA
jgi:hypothetical protein